jgi:hypothetical protein
LQSQLQLHSTELKQCDEGIEEFHEKQIGLPLQHFSELDIVKADPLLHSSQVRINLVSVLGVLMMKTDQEYEEYLLLGYDAV